jgi:hypothetical protein
MKTYGEMEFTSALDGGEWPASRPCRFTPREKVVVPAVQEAGWDPKPVSMLQRGEKISCPYRESKPEFSVQSSRYTDRLGSLLWVNIHLFVFPF